MSQEQFPPNKKQTETSNQKRFEQKNSSFFKCLKIFGDEWNLFIISILAKEEKRFCGLQRELHNINPVTLTNRLKKLEALDFIERKTETIDKLSVSYSLTKKGKAMIPIIEKIEEYAKKHL